MTPTEIIYRAWLNTPGPIVSPAGGKTTGKPLNLLAPEKMAGYNARYSGTCHICGTRAEGGVPVRTLMGENFTDSDRARAPEARCICPACAFSLGTSPEGRAAIRWHPLVAARTLGFLSRGEIRGVLLNPPEPPFVILLPVSRKKHLAIKAEAGFRRDRFPVALEEETVWLDSDFPQILQHVEARPGGRALMEAARQSRQYAVAAYVAGKGNDESAD